MAKERATAAQRRKILVRARGRCEYCRTPEPFVPDPFAVEHIVPSSKDGKTRLNNLASACSAYNGRKYNKVDGFAPLTQEPAPLFNPRKQRWQDHFIWSEDGLLIIGFTPTG
jgi:5-methylcytosine-specific restriction endonuclease McrA